MHWLTVKTALLLATDSVRVNVSQDDQNSDRKIDLNHFARPNPSTSSNQSYRFKFSTVYG